ncbi:hypothetical protein PoB_001053700 [Plakobranchus ocellatus]|uniref:Uncharacterized protein n=1 Tax=Plakobranchus ocellatus TaxID=259542 RepID=A0AAV3YM84_9GAST|nr:hypothetical protein PoB_001053700 [Plakobranchus ocellatus]
MDVSKSWSRALSLGANFTQQWLQRYDWEILPHPAHSPDLAPSDFHLFGPLKRHSGGMAFETEDDLITELRNFIGLIILTLISFEWVSIRCCRAGKNASISTGITWRSSGRVNFNLYVQISGLSLSFLYIASPQQGDLRLSGPPSGQGAGSGARTRDRRVPADLKADSQATVLPSKFRDNDDEMIGTWYTRLNICTVLSMASSRRGRRSRGGEEEQEEVGGGGEEKKEVREEEIPKKETLMANIEILKFDGIVTILLISQIKSKKTALPRPDVENSMNGISPNWMPDPHGIRRANQIDKTSMFLFPLGFLAFIAIYVLAYKFVT